MKVQRKRAFVNNLLKALVISGLVIVASTNPLFGIRAITALQKDLKRKKWNDLKKGLHYLKYRGFIEVDQNPDGSYSVKPTKIGEQQAQKYVLDDIFIKIPKKWDKKWRVVIFDIPTEKQKGRLALLAKLRELRFIMLQKSVWVHPFECYSEVAVLAKAFEVDRHLNYLTCADVSAGDYLRDEFEKRNGLKLV